MGAKSRSPRPRGTFGVARINILGVLARANAMYAAILLAAASFVSPTISMTVFLALIQALETAQKNAAQGTKGLATLRNTKRDDLWTAMESLRTYIQGLADKLTAENGASLIESAGLLVWAMGARAKAILQAKLTTTPGVVHLIANATLLVGNTSKSVTFNWEMSTDGKNWTTLPSTPLADTFTPSLALNADYQFRVSVTIARTPGGWSQPVALHVH